MAERTTQSWTTVPHFFVTRDVDADRAATPRARHCCRRSRQSHGVQRHAHRSARCAVGRALRKHPRMNASWTADGIVAASGRQRGPRDGCREGVVTAVIPAPTRATRWRTSPSGGAIYRRARAPAAAAGRHLRRDVHDQQPRDVRRRRVHGDHRAAAGGDPRRRRHRRPRRRGRTARPRCRPMMTLTLSSDHRVDRRRRAPARRLADQRRDSVSRPIGTNHRHL